MIQKMFSFFEFIKSVPIVDLSNIIITIVSIFLISIKAFFNAYYKYNMHNHYKVPKKYFEKNIFKVIEESLLEIVALIIVFILLYILEWKFQGNRIFMFIEYFFLLISVFLFIIVNSNQYNKDLVTNKEKIIYLFICCSSAVLIIVSVWNFKNKNNNIFLYIVTIVVWLKAYIYIFKSMEKRRFKYIDEFEFVKINRKEYIIITEYENKAILQEIKYIDRKENKIAINIDYFKIVELNNLYIYAKNDLIVTNLIS